MSLQFHFLRLSGLGLALVIICGVDRPALVAHQVYMHNVIPYYIYVNILTRVMVKDWFLFKTFPCHAE